MSSTRIYRASVIGAARPARGMRGAKAKLQRELVGTMRRQERPMLRIAKQHAPRRDGALHKGLEVRFVSRGGRIFATLHSTVRDKRSGYAYTGVTRKGHRKKWIYPKRAKALGPIEIDGKQRFFKRVRGYRPPYDWGERAADAIDDHMDSVETELGRRILSRLF